MELLYMLTAKDIMTKDVITVPLDMAVEELAALFLENGISGAPVLEDGRLVGVVTENDLIDQNKNVHIPTVLSILDSFVFLEDSERLDREIEKMTGRTVADICSREFTAVDEDDPLNDLATIMAEKGCHTLPVLAAGELVGVVGKTDIIRTLIRR